MLLFSQHGIVLINLCAWARVVETHCQYISVENAIDGWCCRCHAITCRGLDVIGHAMSAAHNQLHFYYGIFISTWFFISTSFLRATTIIFPILDSIFRFRLRTTYAIHMAHTGYDQKQYGILKKFWESSRKGSKAKNEKPCIMMSQISRRTRQGNKTLNNDFEL